MVLVQEWKSHAAILEHKQMGIKLKENLNLKSLKGFIKKASVCLCRRKILICPKSKGGGESHRCNQAILWLLIDGGDAILEESSHISKEMLHPRIKMIN